MQGVPIKFRGKIKDAGGYVYGSYLRLLDCRWGWQHYIVDEGSHKCEVDPDSVRQLAGCDADGNEVYEGDEVNVYHKPSFVKLTGNEELWGVRKVSIYTEVGGEAIGELNNNVDYSFLKKE